MKAMTLRLDAELQQSLDQFSSLIGKPKNRLVNEAVRMFLERRISETERDLQATLDALKTCRTRDPDYEKAITDFAEAEITHHDTDPFECRKTPAKGSVSEEIRGLLHGRLGP